MTRTLLGLSIVLFAVKAAAAQPVPVDGDVHFRNFNLAVARHIALHERLRSEVAGPVASSSARDLNLASDQLAAAIRRARPRASQGDFFDAESTRAIRERLKQALSSPASTVDLEAIDDERPAVVPPRVYLRFPEASEMATMPPSLLALLPRLPGELEYRIVGDNLVLRDVKAALILDYIAGAVPRKQKR